MVLAFWRRMFRLFVRTRKLTVMVRFMGRCLDVGCWGLLMVRVWTWCLVERWGRTCGGWPLRVGLEFGPALGWTCRLLLRIWCLTETCRGIVFGRSFLLP